MRRGSAWMLIAGGLLVALGLAFFASRFASSSPDGLNKVAIDQGFAETETEHATADSPLAGYGVEGVEDEGLSTGVAGIVGVALTFSIAMLVFALVSARRRRGRIGRKRGDRVGLIRRSSVSGGHAHALFVHGDGPLHRLPPQCKIVAQVAFVFAVVATPREAFWAFGIYAIIVAVVAQAAGLSLGFVARRLVIEVPFVVFAVFLPLVGQGERVDVLGMSLSVEGLWAMWNILVKGTIGVGASVIVAATTSVADFLRGLDRLRLPRAFTSIAGFMVRYSEVITSEAQRMRIARESRGYDARWLWQAKGFAASAGALFIRSFERGERVHLAMLARGYDGTMPETDRAGATAAQWMTCLAIPALATLVAVTAWVMV